MRRRTIAVTVLLGLLAAGLVLVASPAAACSCAGLPEPDEEIFEGRALGRDAERDFGEAWHFRVTRSVRGAPSDIEVVQIATGQSSACGFEEALAVGGLYRIGTRPNPAGQFANICTGSFERLAGPLADRAASNAYVTAVHRDLRATAPSTRQLDYWSTYLDAGGTRRRFVGDLLRSRRSSRRLVAAASWRWLDRPPTPAEAKPLAAELRRGASAESLDAFLLATDEVYAAAGGTPASWVRRLYTLVLERSADEAGVRDWTASLAAGSPRIAVPAGLLATRRAAQLDVDRAFDAYLQRAPGAERRGRVARLRQGGGRLGLVEDLLVSREYVDRARATTRPAEIVSCGRLPFSSEALDSPVGAERSDDPAAAALRALIERGIDGPIPRSGWRLLVRTDTQATFGHGPLPDFFGVTVGIRDGAWRFAGSGGCEPQLFRPDLNNATWEPAPGQVLDAGTTSFDALVVERECASGQSSQDRVQPPEIRYEDEAVVIAFFVEPPAGNAQTCPGNPPSTVTVTLEQPLGDRTLLDGVWYPPRQPSID